MSGADWTMKCVAKRTKGLSLGGRGSSFVYFLKVSSNLLKNCRIFLWSLLDFFYFLIINRLYHKLLHVFYQQLIILSCLSLSVEFIWWFHCGSASGTVSFPTWKTACPCWTLVAIWSALSLAASIIYCFSSGVQQWDSKNLQISPGEIKSSQWPGKLLSENFRVLWKTSQLILGQT